VSPGEYRVALDLIVRALLLLVLPLLRWLLRSGVENPATRRRRLNRVVPLITLHVRASRRLVGDLSETFIRAQALEQVEQDDPFIPALAGYAEQSVRTSLESLVDDYIESPNGREVFAEQGGSTFIRHTEQAGRQMVMDAVEPVDEGDPDNTVAEQKEGTSPDPDEVVDETPLAVVTGLPKRQPESKNKSRDPRRPFAYARVLNGEDSCYFCIMLASRRPMYESASTAIDSDPKVGRRGDIYTTYHEDCDCSCVPVYTSKSWPGKAEQRELEKLWLDSTKGFYQGDAINKFRQEIRRKTKAGEPLYPGFVAKPRQTRFERGLTLVA
jgi:hypothetical protein